MRNKNFISEISISIVLAVFISIFAASLDTNEYLNAFFEKYSLFFIYIIVTIIIITTITTIISAIKLHFNQKKILKDMNISLPIRMTTSDKQEYLESEILRLSERLVASEDKWKSAYHLLLASQNRQMDINGLISTSNFLKSFGIDVNNVSIKNSTAFVLMPFNSEYIETFAHIVTTCQDLKIKALRSDEEFIQSNILTHIIKCIVESRVIIAVIDGRNVNVFYELGIAHALNKPTILISKVESSIPFDIQGQYIVLYNSFDELEEKLNDALLKILTNTN